MPSRNFCDLCDEVIEGVYFALEIEPRESDMGDVPTYLSGTYHRHTPIVAHDGMVCEKCATAILKLRESLAKNRQV